MNQHNLWRALLGASILAVAACGGGGGGGTAAGPAAAKEVLITAQPAALRQGESALITFALDAPASDFGPEDVTVQGGTLADFIQVSPQVYTARFESNTSLGDFIGVSASVGAPGQAPSKVDIAVDPRPPLAYAANQQPVSYTPSDDYSFYSPGFQTVNVDFSTYAPPAFHGEAFPSDFVVYAQFSTTLAYVTKTGSVKWTYPSWGRFVTTTDSNILVSHFGDTHVVDVLDFSGALQYTMAFDMPVNYAKVEEGRLIVLYAEVAPAEVYGWSNATGRGALLARSSPVSYARSATLEGDKIAIADTFGQRTFIESLATGEMISSFPMSYPNDVDWRGDFLFVVEEHADRVVAFNTVSKKEFVVMAPPAPEFWTPELAGYPLEFCGTEAPYARSRSADACSGAFTLYAPNGFAIRKDGMYVADTDNSRVIFVKDGVVKSVLLGLDNPVKIAEIPQNP